MSLADIKTNVEAETEGVWRDLYGMSFKISRLGTKEAKAEHRKQRARFYGSGRKAEKKAEKGEHDEEIMQNVIINACVHDWDNVRLTAKSPIIKFSKSECRKLLMNPEYRILIEEIAEIATDDENYREESIKDDEEIAVK